MQKIKVQVLTEEAFAPYGTVLATEVSKAERNPGVSDWYGNVAVMEGIDSAAFNLMTVYPREAVCRKFECHLKSKEAVIPMDGKGIIIPLAPPGEFDASRVTAFYVPGNKAVVFHPGTWHFAPYTYEDAATFITAYRSRTPEDDVYFAPLPEDAGLEL